MGLLQVLVGVALIVTGFMQLPSIGLVVCVMIFAGGFLTANGLMKVARD